MKLLSDRELHDKIVNAELVSEGFSERDQSCWTAKESAIQPSSLDLHIGEIYIPQTDEKFVKDYCLEPGETVVIRTREVLKLSKNYAAIGFPPTSMSRKAILTTNPGHVDPGYEGVFHITLINMGKKSYPLTGETIIATLLFFELDDNVVKGYLERMSGPCQNNSDDPPGELDYLAPDFMDFKTRTKKMVGKAVFWAGWWKETIKVLVTLSVAFAGGFWGYMKIEDRVKGLEEVKVEKQFNEIRNEINELQYYDKVTLKNKIAQIEKMQVQHSKDGVGNTNSGADKK